MKPPLVALSAGEVDGIDAPCPGRHCLRAAAWVRPAGVTLPRAAQAFRPQRRHPGDRAEGGPTISAISACEP